MADATTDFFAALADRTQVPLLGKATGTIRFDLRDGRRTDRWLVSIVKGEVAVSRRHVRADCVVSTDKELFDSVVSGKSNAMAATLRGELGLEGDPQMFVMFQRLLPGPPRRRRRSRATAPPRRKP